MHPGSRQVTEAAQQEKDAEAAAWVEAEKRRQEAFDHYFLLALVGLGTAGLGDAILGAVGLEAEAGIGLEAETGAGAAEETAGTLGDAQEGQTVYRVWGGDPSNPDLAPNQSGPWGQSWTRVDPASVAKYRDVAGLPDEANLGRFVSQGTLQDTTGVEVRGALQLGANAGGLDELLIPNPESQVLLSEVFGVNPPF